MLRRRIVLIFLAVCLAVAVLFALWPAPPAPSALAEELEGAPGVASATASVTARQPALTIVHLRDYRLVPRTLYGGDYGAHLDAVEAVQDEQVALLRWLIENYEVRCVYVEGLTEADLPVFRMRAGIEGKLQAEEVPKLYAQLEALGKQQGDAARKEEAEIRSRLDEHRERALKLGVAGRLLHAGELEVLPLEAAKTLRPVTPAGAGVPVAQAARQDEMVRAMRTSGEAVAVVILGAEHDLSASVRRLGQGRVEYVRVTTKQVERLVDEEE
jgi:hypothetical protein